MYVSRRIPGIRWTSRYVDAVALAGVFLALGACGTNGPPSTQPYVLFAPLQSNVTYLMDLQYQAVHQWRADSTPSCSVYLLEDGRLLRPRSLGEGSFPNGGCNGGRVELLDWDGKVTWSFDYFGADHQQHHDVRWMPNGHLLLVAWETRTAAEALAAGRNAETIPASGVIWVDHVVEVDPASSTIVWVWKAWDHLLPSGADPRAHPELIDPNAWATTSSDWTHTNAIDYNAELDQIVLSVRNHHEIWVIDHGTTTAEAAGHAGGKRGRGGDLLYRWGNPVDYGFDGAQQLFGQHNAHWIDPGLPGAGHMLIFDNGDRNTRRFSTVVEIEPPLQANGLYAFDAQTGYPPAAPVWQWMATPPESVFAAIISGAQRLVSGNTLVCDGPAGHFFEVTTAGNTIWEYKATSSTRASAVLVFRVTRYEAGFPGLDGKTLSPAGPVDVELVPTPAGVRQPAF